METNDFLELDLRSINPRELKNILEEFEGRDFLPEIKNSYMRGFFEHKICKAEIIMADFEMGERLKERRAEIQRQLEEIEKGKEEKREKLERAREGIRKILNDNENFVFERNKLTKEQIMVLQEEGYELTNEYCVFRKKVVSTYIKTVLHHSKTHVFLVWSMKKFLEECFGVFLQKPCDDLQQLRYGSVWEITKEENVQQSVLSK